MPNGKNRRSLFPFVLGLLRKQSHVRTLQIEISCSAQTMGLLSTLEVEVLYRKVALPPGAARRGLGRRRVLYKKETILQKLSKRRGEAISPPPPL
jgi:hypothetical protein